MITFKKANQLKTILLITLPFLALGNLALGETNPLIGGRYVLQIPQSIPKDMEEFFDGLRSGRESFAFGKETIIINDKIASSVTGYIVKPRFVSVGTEDSVIDFEINGDTIIQYYSSVKDLDTGKSFFQKTVPGKGTPVIYKRIKSKHGDLKGSSLLGEWKPKIPSNTAPKEVKRAYEFWKNAIYVFFEDSQLEVASDFEYWNKVEYEVFGNRIIVWLDVDKKKREGTVYEVISPHIIDSIHN